jgi:hypothetical protein
MRTFLGFIFLSVISSAAAWAQSTAQIHGTVQDSTGAAVPGAELKATQTATNTVRTTTSAADGGYVFTNLPLGPYQVEVSKQGFTKYVQSGIVLQVGSDPLVDVALKVGAVTEQVNVEANATLVETRNSGVSSVIETERILELPLNGRQPTDLITLSGAAVSITNMTGRGIIGAPVVNVAGGVSYGVGYSLDGANYFNYVYATTNLMPFPDALQEFKVDTSGTTAQQGSYASVSAVTKSGTNQIHGDVFEFIRNGSLNARNTLQPVRDSVKRNQFGGTIGGAIKKDKLFFFAGYQGTTIRATTPTINFLPTPQMLQGDWTTYASVGCNGRQLNLTGTGGVFVNNTIRPQQFDPVALNVVTRILKTSPAPNPCGVVNYGTPSAENDFQVLGRLDYQMSDKNTVFARYFVYHPLNKPAGELTTNLLASTTPGNENKMQSVVLGDTYVISPTMVNSVRLSTTRAWFTNLSPSFFSWCDVGMSNVYCGYDPKHLTLRLGNAFTLSGGLGDGAITGGQNFNINEDISWIKGSHQFSFGANPRLDYYHDTDLFFGMLQIQGSTNVTGSFLSDFMTGNVQAVSQSAPLYVYGKQVGITLYATDTWKASQKLTVTYGIRWDPWLPETVLSRQSASFDASRFSQGLSSTIYKGSPPGFTYPGDPGFPNGLKGSDNNWKQFAPRVGLAFDPKGDGKTSIRASWGLSYSNTGPHHRDDQVQNAPFLNLTAPTVPQGNGGRLGSLDNPWSALPAGNPFPAAFGTFSPFADYTALPYHLPSPYLITWNFSIQRQIGTNWLVSASYIGSHTTHLWTLQPTNYAVLVPNTAGTPLGTCPPNVTVGCNSLSNTNQRRILNLANPKAQIGNMVLVDPSGTGSYNGLLLSAQHRFGSSFSVQTNYTLSHCISDFDPNPTMQGGAGEGTWTDPHNRAFDRGACNADRRNVFNLTGVAQVPKFSGRALRMIASGWQVAPIFRRQTGQPLNIIEGSDRALEGVQDFLKGVQFQRANCLSGVDPYLSTNGNSLYLNPAAFSQPALGTLGNCAFNSLHAPTYFAFDMALSRTFQIHERQRIEIRAEAFNVTNTYRPGQCSVATNYCSFLATPLYNGQYTSNSGFTTRAGANFGKILTAMDPRIMQFALKYVF